MTLTTPQDAKEFLIGQIVPQAQLDGVGLAAVERKMLYFSEGHWTLPDIMEVNEEFERDYVQEEYEEKIASLILSCQEAGAQRRQE
jgi:hypothetical protein